MHELSVATSVVETLTRELADHRGRVVSVRLRIGELSGVVPDALRFAWEIACRETRFDGSSLVVENVQVRAWCDACGCDQELPGVTAMLCPVCGEPVSRVITGRELEIHSVEVAENE